jgi:hypothetical protein
MSRAHPSLLSGTESAARIDVESYGVVWRPPFATNAVFRDRTCVSSIRFCLRFYALMLTQSALISVRMIP